MNDLTLSLIGLGAAFVAAVWGYNKLQERKYRQAAEKVFRGEQADVLAPAGDDGAAELPVEPRIEPDYAAYPDERREPVFEAEHAALQAEPEDEESSSVSQAYSAAMTDTPIDAAPQPAASGMSAEGNAPPADWCDESIDLIARLHFNDGIAADDLRQAQSAMQAHQRVHLRVFVETASGRWQPLAESGSGTFAQAWFALQLVDRRGAVSVNDFEALRSSLQALASLRNGNLLFPDVAAMGEQARALDDFCAQLDLQLAVNVLDAGNGAFPGTKVRGMAEAAGMRLTGNGEFHAEDENGNFMFALANMGEPFDAQTMKNLQTHGLTFLLDVPHVRDGGHAFERMLSSARQFANTLDAALVNAQRAPISDAMVDGIRKKIHEIHEQMNLAGIPAGGMRALRLFS
ncbi:MAG TPA: cell division protein ZipA C-terminal FtsZ-binding domain-containing protein [Rhodocyclaceae bacterium]|nr:cell division protein ZipA C-terminal FtsZ-binding domain-containing protein [Rhodocyclaceae bacterium]